MEMSIKLSVDVSEGPLGLQNWKNEDNKKGIQSP